MPELKHVQAAFSRYLLHGEEDIATHIADAGGIDARARLAVYANGYRARLREALQGDFSALAHVLGETDFSALCESYIDTHPSPYFSLRDYGARLPAWLGEQAIAAGRPWLVELAALEWALVEAFDAPAGTTATVADAAQLAPTQWPAMCVRFIPGLQLVPQHWDILAPWHAAKAGEPAGTVSALPAPTVCVVWRDETLVTRLRSAEADEATALHQAQDGQAFAEICARLGEPTDSPAPGQNGLTPEQAALRAASLLKSWLESGLVASIGLIETPTGN